MTSNAWVRRILLLGLWLPVLGATGGKEAGFPPTGIPSAAPASPTAPGLQKNGETLEYGFCTLNGNWESAKSNRGNVVFIFFWATWCQPSVEMLADLEWLWKKYRESSVNVLAVALDSEPDGVRAFIRSQKLELPCAILPQELMTSSGLAAGIPTLYLLSRSGVILKKKEGNAGRDWLEHEVAGQISMPEEP